MAIKDVRSFIEVLEKLGELVHVKEEVDWDCEIGAIVRRVYDTGAPAPLFENIRDYPGHRIFAGHTCSWGRQAVTMGLPFDTPIPEILDAWDKGVANPIKPVEVKDAPCQENMVSGKDVDLFMFPAPMVHDGDGGRYLSTWHIIITKDYDTDWTNWGMYRQMIHNERLMGGLTIPTQDIGRHRAKWEARGELMPFATAISPDLISAAIAGTPVGVGVDEVDIAGGLIGEPVELVKCKTVPLMVPAHAEIILEGHMLPPTQMLEEGPFGEYTGFRATPRAPRSVYRVECITWRNDPIVVLSNMGMPPCDGYMFWVTGLRSMAKKVLEHLPITQVYLPPEGVGHLIIVATKKPYNHIADQIAHALSGYPSTLMMMDKLIVVDDDVDIFNWGEVIHAMVSKLHPLKGVITYPSWANPLSSFLSLSERTQGRGGRLVLDCTWPLEWDPETEKPVKSSFKDIYSKETQNTVLEKWTKYGFKA